VSVPTSGERLLAARLGVDSHAVARAREALNFIAGLSWPRPERVSLLARLARSARADVGTVLGGLAIDAAPLASFDHLIPIRGLYMYRIGGLVRALADFDVAKLGPEAGELHRTRQAVATLRVENQTLRAELNRALAALHRARDTAPEHRPSAIRLSDVADSITSQVLGVHDVLRTRQSGLRMSGIELRLRGSAALLDEEVALDLAAPEGGSSVTLAFGTGATESAAAADATVPDVRGYTPALARRKVLDAGFTVALLTSGEVGAVREQLPAPGARVPRGTEVRLVVR
jgi:hypothetical protein